MLAHVLYHIVFTTMMRNLYINYAANIKNFWVPLNLLVEVFKVYFGTTVLLVVGLNFCCNFLILITYITFFFNYIPLGPMVRIHDFHSCGPGSIPGVGNFLYKHITFIFAYKTYNRVLLIKIRIIISLLKHLPKIVI